MTSSVFEMGERKSLLWDLLFWTWEDADTVLWPISERCCYGKTLQWGIWGSQEWAGWVTNTQLKVNLKNKQRGSWITEEKRHIKITHKMSACSHRLRQKVHHGELELWLIGMRLEGTEIQTHKRLWGSKWSGGHTHKFLRLQWGGVHTDSHRHKTTTGDKNTTFMRGSPPLCRIRDVFNSHWNIKKKRFGITSSKKQQQHLQYIP